MGARSVNVQGQRLFQRRVGQAQFERRTTIVPTLEIMVGRRGEAPLVPPYIQPRFKKALALVNGERPRSRCGLVCHASQSSSAARVACNNSICRVLTGIAVPRGGTRGMSRSTRTRCNSWMPAPVVEETRMTR